MLIEASRDPLWARASSLFALSTFGFIHGAHEWLEITIINPEILDVKFPTNINWIRISILLISFAVLMFFSLQVIRSGKNFSKRGFNFITGAILLYSVTIFTISFASTYSHSDLVLHLDELTRIILAVPAACLAGYAFFDRAREVKSANKTNLAILFGLISASFFVYGFSQTVTAPTDTIPSIYWNSEIFINIFGVPIQLIRALSALAITISLVRVTQITSAENRRELIRAQNERLAAMEEVQSEMKKRGDLQRNLVQHMVKIQEQEKEHISRELHDETSQLLTAISLHLEALRKIDTTSNDFYRKLDSIQQLRHRLADGIYRLMHDLHPRQLDDLGLIAAINSLIADIDKNMDLVIKFSVTGEPRRLGSYQEIVLFRVIQESLTNIVRHSGVNQAIISIEFHEDDLILSVSDRGIGFNLKDVNQDHQNWGLIGMRERVNSIGGKLIIKSNPGNGTDIIASVPTNQVVFPGAGNEEN